LYSLQWECGFVEALSLVFAPRPSIQKERNGKGTKQGKSVGMCVELENVRYGYKLIVQMREKRPPKGGGKSYRGFISRKIVYSSFKM
jgi:hypothetical protein